MSFAWESFLLRGQRSSLSLTEPQRPRVRCHAIQTDRELSAEIHLPTAPLVRQELCSQLQSHTCSDLPVLHTDPVVRITVWSTVLMGGYVRHKHHLFRSDNIMIWLKTPASVSTTTAGNCPAFMWYYLILLPQNLTGKCPRLITTRSSVAINMSVILQCFFESFPFCCHGNMISGSNTLHVAPSSAVITCSLNIIIL